MYIHVLVWAALCKNTPIMYVAEGCPFKRQNGSSTCSCGQWPKETFPFIASVA